MMGKKKHHSLPLLLVLSGLTARANKQQQKTELEPAEQHKMKEKLTVWMKCNSRHRVHAGFGDILKIHGNVPEKEKKPTG